MVGSTQVQHACTFKRLKCTPGGQICRSTCKHDCHLARDTTQPPTNTPVCMFRFLLPGQIIENHSSSTGAFVTASEDITCASDNFTPCRIHTVANQLTEPRLQV